jgi:hypothetical protein
MHVSAVLGSAVACAAVACAAVACVTLAGPARAGDAPAPNSTNQDQRSTPQPAPTGCPFRNGKLELIA